MSDRKPLSGSEKTPEDWSQQQMDTIHQILTPVQILTETDLQNEMEYFTGTQQLRYTQPSSYFEERTQSFRPTPQLNIPVHAKDYALSNANNASFSKNFKSKRVVFDRHSSHEGSSSIVLNHDPGMYTKPVVNHHTTTSKYSTQTTPVNSQPTSPTTYDPNYHHQTHHYGGQQQQQQPDKFATMFLSSSNMSNLLIGQKPRSKPDAKLDSLLLSKHNLEQDQITDKKRKKKAAVAAVPIKPIKKKKAKKAVSSDEEEEEEEGEEDEPIIGDGAQSYSSMGSSSSRTSLTKDDKRRRNTAASARFRIKKKMREQALQNTACEMTDKAKLMERRVHELESEIKWLKALVVEKNESRIEQLVRERPATSTAFPSYNNSSSNNEYEEEDDEDYTYQY
ncbi:hypothetical protein HPULCUR_001342 [Helicostylum pulchrum]|uniref:BZIP domain-containing protein n=1 Tax=Helicostylum pulchrum TaxID=562976 RepID=A0ABP9XMF0_9FUNG